MPPVKALMFGDLGSVARLVVAGCSGPMNPGSSKAGSDRLFFGIYPGVPQSKYVGSGCEPYPAKK